jgi:hypothetical protein
MFDCGPLLERTHQTWKLGASVAANILAVGLLFLPDAFHNGVPNLWIFGCVIVLCVSSLVIFFGMIRCPACHAHWMWLACKQPATSDWLKWLRNQYKCPSCGSICVRGG